MAIHELKEQIARLPEQPGVYLYFNTGGDTIYVGKARALRDRVRNYLGAYGSDPKTDALLDEVVCLEGRNEELVKTLKARMLDAAQDERFEEAAQLRDAMRTVQALHDRQQKMATAELGHRDVFGLKLGPAGAVIQVFQVRSGRVVERVELGTEDSILAEREGEALAAAIQQFYELRSAPPEIH